MKPLVYFLLVGFHFALQAQERQYHFKPGFDACESHDMLQLNLAFSDTVEADRLKDFLPGYSFLYRSPSLGFDNVWDLWLRTDSTVVIALRGTTSDPKSILVDFYGAMFPAVGNLVLDDTDTISYRFAEHPRAALHGGWLLGFGYLSRDIKPKIDSLYRAGHRDVIVTGHSQGGALCYLMSAWLWYLEKDGLYPGLRVKTYASASPKVGNMYFAYDYDFLTQSQWSFSIVNAADMVPEFPFTTQQIEEDMTEPNPYLRLEQSAGKLPFLKRWVVSRAMRKMRKQAAKSARAYQQYFGNMVGKLVTDAMPGIVLPPAVNSTYYVRPGVPVTLIPDTAYYNHFEPIKEGDYYHHDVRCYQFLLKGSYKQYFEGL